MYWDFQTQLQVKVIQTEGTFFYASHVHPHSCDNKLDTILKSVVEDLKLKRQEMPLTLLIGIQIQFLTVFSTLPNKWRESNTTHHQQNLKRRIDYLANIMLSIQSMCERE